MKYETVVNVLGITLRIALVAFFLIVNQQIVLAQYNSNSFGGRFRLTNRTNEILLVACMSYNQGDPLKKARPGESTLSYVPSAPSISFNGWKMVNPNQSADFPSSTLYIVGNTSKARYFPGTKSGNFRGKPGVINAGIISATRGWNFRVDVLHGNRSYPGADNLSSAVRKSQFMNRVSAVANSKGVRYETLQGNGATIRKTALLTNRLNFEVLYAYSEKGDIRNGFQTTSSQDWRLMPSGETHYVKPGFYFVMGKNDQNVYRVSHGDKSTYIGGAISPGANFGGNLWGHKVGSINYANEHAKHGKKFSWTKTGTHNSYEATFQSISQTKPNVISYSLTGTYEGQSGQSVIPTIPKTNPTIPKTLPKLPTLPQNVGNRDFYREWYVRYVTEPQYSGKINIRKVNGKTQVSGEYSKGSQKFYYNSTQVRFPNANTMVLNYQTAKGYQGQITYTLSANGATATGNYDQYKQSVLTPVTGL